MQTHNRTIVAALIWSKDHKLLMGKKDKDKGVYPNCWHIPGGGIEKGEDDLTALKREAKEEANLNIDGYQATLIADTDTDTVEKMLESGEKITVKMHFYIYEIIIADKNADEINISPTDELVKLRWFTVRELQQVKLTPPSEKFFKKLGYI